MTKPRIRVQSRDYTADDAQRVLENLRSGPLGEGVVRYRRFGGYFALTDERKPVEGGTEVENLKGVIAS